MKIILLYIPFLLFFLLKIDIINRFFVDGTLLIISFFFINKKNFIFFLLLILSSIILYLKTFNYLSLLNLSLFPLCLSFSTKFNKNINIIYHVKILVFITFFITLFDLSIGNFVESGDRIAGPFTSSLHLSYFCVFTTLYLLVIKPKFYFLYTTFLLICCVISGSRVGTIGNLLLLFFSLNNNLKLYFLILVSPFLLFVISKFDIRAFSYIPDAEAVRFGGWVEFVKILNLDWIFTGAGRYRYGATGYRFIGEDAFITESSLLMILYSYGFFIGIFILFYFYVNFYNLLKKFNTPNYYRLLVFFSIFSPFFDSTAVLFLNMVLLSSLNYNVTKQTSITI